MKTQEKVIQENGLHVVNTHNQKVELRIKV